MLKITRHDSLALYSFCNLQGLMPSSKLSHCLLPLHTSTHWDTRRATLLSVLLTPCAGHWDSLREEWHSLHVWLPWPLTHYIHYILHYDLKSQLDISIIDLVANLTLTCWTWQWSLSILHKKTFFFNFTILSPSLYLKTLKNPKTPIPPTSLNHLRRQTHIMTPRGPPQENHA